MVQTSDFIGTSPSGSDAHWRVPQGSSPRLILSASQDVRAHASIFNHSNGALYLKFGGNGGMSVSGNLGLFTTKLLSGSYYEMPKPIWQGEVWGVWDSDLPAGFAMVTQTGRAGR